MSLSMSSTSLSRSFKSLSSVRVVNTLDPASVLVVVLALREGSLRTTTAPHASQRLNYFMLPPRFPVGDDERTVVAIVVDNRSFSTTSSVGIDVDVVSVRLESYIGAVESDNRSVDNAIGRRPRPLRFYVFVRRFDSRLSSPR